MAETKRKPISKSLRFEVFKRDAFTCQYCGRSAPDVILEVDHIVPVAEGGKNELINLVTSCRECNRGKGKRQLSDDTAVKAQKRQLDEINAMREQTEMMLKWREELIRAEDFQARAVDEAIHRGTNYELTEYGRRKVRLLIRQFGFAEVLEAAEIANMQYVIRGTKREVAYALEKIGGICYNRRKAKDGEG